MEQNLKDDLAKLRRKLFFKTCEEVCKLSGPKKDEGEELKTVINLFLKLLVFLAIRFKHKNIIEFVILVLFNLWRRHVENKEDLVKLFEELDEELEENTDN